MTKPSSLKIRSELGLVCLLLLFGACGVTKTDFGGIDAHGADASTLDVATTDTAGTDLAATDTAGIDARADLNATDLASTDLAGIDAGADLTGIDVRADLNATDLVSTDLPGIDAGIDALADRIPSACAQAKVVLGAASNFVVLAGSTVTNTGLTSVTGDLGVSPGTAVAGFPPGIVVGAQHAGNPTAAAGIAALTTAYNDAAGRTLCPVTVSGNLGGQTLPPGLYKSTSSLEISSGNLTLDGQGDPEAVFIFQMASTFTTTSGRQVTLIGGARSVNVFWQVGTSATLGSTSSFQGTLMADQAITLNTGATVNGRLLARIAAVSLDANTIVKPAL